MGVTIRKSLNIVDALASKILLNNIATLLGELLVDSCITGVLVSRTDEEELGVSIESVLCIEVKVSLLTL